MLVVGVLFWTVALVSVVLWLHRRVEAWIPERRRDVVIVVAVFTVGLPVTVLAVLVPSGAASTWDLVLSPLAAVAMGALVGLLVTYVLLWTVDHVTGEPTERLKDATVSWLPMPLARDLRERRGPFWSLLTPVRVIRRERERDE